VKVCVFVYPTPSGATMPKYYEDFKQVIWTINIHKH